MLTSFMYQKATICYLLHNNCFLSREECKQHFENFILLKYIPVCWASYFVPAKVNYATFATVKQKKHLNDYQFWHWLQFFQLNMVIHFKNDVKAATLLQQNIKTDFLVSSSYCHPSLRKNIGNTFYFRRGDIYFLIYTESLWSTWYYYNKDLQQLWGFCISNPKKFNKFLRPLLNTKSTY